MRRLILLMIAALTALGGVAYATHAIRAAAEQRLRLAVTPMSQSVVQGGTARFSVDVTRAQRSINPTRMRLSSLPRGVRARWRLADGTPTAKIPVTQSGAILTLQTSAGTPLGARRIRVLAIGGGTTRTRTLRLTVMRNSIRHFSLRVSPARRLVEQGSAASYALRVARARGFRRRVSMRVLGASQRMRATWTPISLRLRTAANQRLGSARVVIQGTSWVGGRAIRRYAVIVVTVVGRRPATAPAADGPAFGIGGNLATLLHPGAGAPLDLLLTNPHDFELLVTALTVSVGAVTTKPDCSGDTNYTATQYSGSYPLLLAPGSRRLSAIVPNASSWPRVSMHDLPTNQDACRGAVVALDYSGQATR